MIIKLIDKYNLNSIQLKCNLENNIIIDNYDIILISSKYNIIPKYLKLLLNQLFFQAKEPQLQLLYQ